MDPYRSPVWKARPSVAYGHPRRGALAIACGLALLVSTAGMLLWWAVHGGGIRGTVVLPAVFGALLIARSRWGALTLARERRLLTVARRGLWPSRRIDVPLSELQSVEVEVSSFKAEPATYDLNLLLRADRRIHLRRADTLQELEPDRSRIADFLREEDLLWGAGDPPREGASGGGTRSKNE